MDNQNGYYYNPQPPYNGYYGRPPERPKRGGGVFAAIVIIVVTVLLVALVIGLLAPTQRDGLGELGITPSPSAVLEATATPIPTATPVVDEEDRNMPELDGISPNIPGMIDNPIPDIFDAVSPGVVGVVNYQNLVINGREQLQVYGSGSGFIVSSSGYILTNAHVIEDASVVAIRFSDGEEVDAKVIGSDAETDVAVLKIERSGLSPLGLGDSDTVRVGEYVLAIGNPLDSDRLANTITFGIISAKAREITIDAYTNTFLQTDAAINFGNSGGPLLNMQGEVIGMNSAKTVTAGYDAYGNAISAEGIGFALPINK
ncbi:MAG: trypsin-like peptidase domain-containing protein, partial [Clostridia bacterium]|nr:trypsin-like peptidase domain-containing protein [Clostridia bacterium]